MGQPATHLDERRQRRQQQHAPAGKGRHGEVEPRQREERDRECPTGRVHDHLDFGAPRDDVSAEPGLGLDHGRHHSSCLVLRRNQHRQPATAGFSRRDGPSGYLSLSVSGRVCGVMGLGPLGEAAPPVELHDYIRVLRKQWVLIALTAALAVAAAIGYTVRATPLYQSSIKLFVSAQERTTDTSSTAYQGGLFSQQRAKSYADLLSGPRVAESVVADLKLSMTPGQLQAKVKAQALPDTVLLTASVTDTNRAQAQRLANAVGVQFAALVDQLERPTTGGPAPIKVEVVENARLPGGPVSPQPTRNVGLALVLGLLLGIGIAVLRETLDTTVKSTQDLQERVGAPVLGVIGFDPEAKTRPLIVQADPHSSRAEAFRQLRTNLQFVDVDHRPTSIVVTSSLSEEGKTTTTANLAISLSQAGIRLALLEGDLRRPRMAEYLALIHI